MSILRNGHIAMLNLSIIAPVSGPRWRNSRQEQTVPILIDYAFFNWSHTIYGTWLFTTWVRGSQPTVAVEVRDTSNPQTHIVRDTVGGRGDSIIEPETLYHRDDALLYIAYVMLIWAAPIPADRWHCSLWP